MDKEATQNFSSMTLVPNPLTVPITVTSILRYTAKKKIKYGEVWGLAQQAAQLAVENGSHSKIIKWLKQFINSQHTGSVQNQNLLEHPKVQVADNNKENESEQIENPLVS
jgi:hypothetical protein